MCQNEFNLGERFMERLVWDVKPEYRVRLTVGNTAIDGSYFARDAFDMRSEVPTTIEPRTVIDLDKAEKWVSTMPNRAELGNRRPILFVGGGYRQLVRLDRVAETLCDEGSLELVEFQPEVAGNESAPRVEENLVAGNG
jgi:hypothetical protein